MNNQLNSALIIVDMQNDYCHPDGALDAPEAIALVQPLQKIINEFHDLALPVIFIQTIHEDATDSEAWLSRGKSRQQSHNGVCRKGTWGSDFYGVAPNENDIVVIKHRYSAFYNTRLDTVLRSLNVNHVYITGVATNVCVEGTVRDAFMRDYHVTVLEDCVGAFTVDAHQYALKTIEGFFGAVKNVEEAIVQLQQNKASVIQV